MWQQEDKKSRFAFKLDNESSGKPLAEMDINEAIEKFKEMHIFVKMDFMTKKRYLNITVECDL